MNITKEQMEEVRQRILARMMEKLERDSVGSLAGFGFNGYRTGYPLSSTTYPPRSSDMNRRPMSYRDLLLATV